MSKFAKTLVEIASRREAQRKAIAAERARLLNQERERSRAQELAQQEYDRRVEEEAERLFEVDELMKLRQIKLGRDYDTGLWLALINQKHLEKGISNLEDFFDDLSQGGLNPDLLGRLSYLTELAGNDVNSYEAIEERVRPMMVAEARDQLREKLEGNPYQEYFVGLLKEE